MNGIGISHSTLFYVQSDVNECQTNNGGCNQTCSNTYGSFECSCGTGYSLAMDGEDCNGSIRISINFFCKIKSK